MNRASDEQLAAVFLRFNAITWPVPHADLPALIHDLGWTVESFGEQVVRAQTGWPITRPRATFSCHSDRLTSVSFELMDIAQGASNRDDINDTLAAALAVGRPIMGAPESRRAKGITTSRWELGNGGRIDVEADDAGVAANIASAEYAEALRLNL